MLWELPYRTFPDVQTHQALSSGRPADPTWLKDFGGGL